MQAQSTTMQAIVDQLNMQTRLFKNVTEGIRDEDAQKQVAPKVNHVAWLTGHIVSTRYMMAGVLGLEMREPYPDLFTDGKGLQEGVQYPTMNELIKDWDTISEAVINKINALPDDVVMNELPQPTPIGDATIKSFMNFCSHHEAYTIGQLGILRRILGYEAMKYN
jgi:hypothetical protein